MRVPFGALALAFLALLSFASPRPARADIQNDIFQVLCMPELDVLEVRELDLTQQAASRLVARRDHALANARSLYVPDWHARLDVDPSDPSYGVQSTQFDCPLASGRAELTIIPEPIPGRGNSIAVTLRFKGRTIVEDVPFILCSKGGPITGLTFVANVRGIIVAGQFGGLWLDEAPRSTISDATRRYFRIERLSNTWGEALPTGKLRSVDIDYHGYDNDVSEGVKAELCRYGGPGSPVTRHR